jgi:hypothetical protein
MKLYDGPFFPGFLLYFLLLDSRHAIEEVYKCRIYSNSKWEEDVFTACETNSHRNVARKKILLRTLQMKI